MGFLSYSKYNYETLSQVFYLSTRVDLIVFKKWRDYVVTKCASSVHQKYWLIILLIKFNNFGFIIIGI
jgi:hypothetical protein